MNWHTRRLPEMSAQQWHDIGRARIAVFVVEQRCPYQELDDNDTDAVHLFAEQNGETAAYCRIIQAADGTHIGRVLVAKAFRGRGLARELMQRALAAVPQHRPVRLAAQTYLLDFYRSFGFCTASPPYLLDGIEHADMILSVSAIEGETV